jgi:periplasmic protein CpxP/Spy
MFFKNIATAVLALTAIAIPAFAQDATKSDAPTSFKARAGHHRGGKGFNPMSKLTGKLALTPEQEQQVTAIRTQTKTEIQSKREQLKAAKLQLRELLSSNETDRSKLEAIHDQIQSQQAAIQKIRFNSMLSMRSILTPEQRAELKAQMQSRFQQRGAAKTDKG